MGLTRRQFLQLTGASTAGAVAFAACTPPRSELTVQSAARLPEDLVTGIDNWYASICRLCPAGCGIIVRVMEGRAKKIEGNPVYPVNQGKLCARGQSGLQVLYHPDRIRGPLRRSGPRGTGQFEQVSWEAALDEVMSRLTPLASAGQLAQVTLMTGPLRGHLGLLVSRLASSSRGLQWMPLDPLEEATLRAALGGPPTQPAAPGIPLPQLDIANARFILSFGADLLSSWISPVQHGVAYGRFRGRPKDRGVLVQVEPRLTATGASADRWIPVRPGSEGYLALAVARVMIERGHGDQTVARELDAATRLYGPAQVAERTGVTIDQIVELADRFATQTPSLAIGGGPAAAHTNGRFNLEAINALNRLVGSAGRAGGILPNPISPLTGVPAAGPGRPLSHWQQFASTIRSGGPTPEVLLVRDANPVFDLPPTLGFLEVLEKVPFTASFSSFMDETTALADLILPGHTYLEEWGSDIPDPGPGFQVAGFQQPVVNPFYDTRSFGDILLILGEDLAFGPDLPWNSMRDAVRAGAQELLGLRRGSVQAAGLEEYWVRLLQQGGWWDERLLAPVVPPVAPARALEAVAPRFAGSEQEYPFHLLPFPSASLGAGSGALLPWLQAMPDPITTAMWMTWVEVNTETARRLGLNERDVVRVESPVGSLEAPVYPHPGIRPDVVAIPMGQGHTALGRYAQGRGANPLHIVDASLLGTDGDLAWAATRVRLVKTGKTVRVSKAEGLIMPREPEDVDIVGVTPG